jgi:Collagen triple helix repeat (20 copies)
VRANAALAGPQGATGAQGTKGATGAKGDKGDRGEAGPIGPSTAYQYLGDGTGAVFSDIYSLQLVHIFPGTGVVALSCGHSVASMNGAHLSNLEITAIKVGGIAANHGI